MRIIDSINKPHRFNEHEHITHVGNNYEGWRMTREAVIRLIDSKQESFCTQNRSTGETAHVGVVHETGKAPYLRTYADGAWTNNLLSLPECNLSSTLVA